MTDNIQSLPLSERARDAERFIRELIDHLENGYLSRIRELRGLVNTESSQLIGDKTVRANVERLLEFDDYSEALWLKTRTYLDSIQDDLERLTSQGDT